MKNTDPGWAHARRRDDEDWNGPFETREEAIADGRDYYGSERFFIALTRPIRPGDEPPAGEDWTFVIDDKSPMEEISPN